MGYALKVMIRDPIRNSVQLKRFECITDLLGIFQMKYDCCRPGGHHKAASEDAPVVVPAPAAPKHVPAPLPVYKSTIKKVDSA